jgi:hypothetical protein
MPFSLPVGVHANESITWNQLDGYNYWMQTGSVHNQGGFALADGSNWVNKHEKLALWDVTWRSYAGDAHPTPVWHVHGVHYTFDAIYGITIFLGYTFATDCNITHGNYLYR